MDAIQLFRAIPEGESVMRIGAIRALRLCRIYLAIATAGAVVAGLAATVFSGGTPAAIIGVLLGFAPLAPFAVLEYAMWGNKHHTPRLRPRAAGEEPALSMMISAAVLCQRAMYPRVLTLWLYPTIALFAVLVWWWSTRGPAEFRTGLMAGSAIAVVTMGTYRFFSHRLRPEYLIRIRHVILRAFGHHDD